MRHKLQCIDANCNQLMAQKAQMEEQLRHQLTEQRTQIEKQCCNIQEQSLCNEDKRKQYEAQILEQVNERIQDLVKQMQDGFNQLTEAVQLADKKASDALEFTKHQPQSRTIHFPQTGILHEIKAGDSLESIAKAYNSQVEFIQAANHIENAQALGIGNRLFVPQELNK